MKNLLHENFFVAIQDKIFIKYIKRSSQPHYVLFLINYQVNENDKSHFNTLCKLITLI